MKKNNIVVDENIAFPEAFELFGNVIKINGREISNSILKDCDILIIRSVTPVNEKLLQNTRVKFVGTATSGTEHIDVNYLNKNKIFFAEAKGCNSFSVAEYVITAILKLLADSKEAFLNKSVGIVGLGSIGSKVENFCQSLGMKVIHNDPPLKRKNLNFTSSSLEEILNCDIISLHVPLTFDGLDKTYNLLDDNLSLVKENSILINTSRGGVINETKLIEISKQKKIRLVTDVWINEPEINIELLTKSDIATPHIAGYSIEGKVNGTKMIFEQLNKFLGTNYDFNFTDNFTEIETIKFDSDFSSESLSELFKKIYDIESDSVRLKEMINMKAEEQKSFFDKLRKEYPLRKSFNNYLIKTSNKSIKKVLENLRFQVDII